MRCEIACYRYKAPRWKEFLDLPEFDCSTVLLWILKAIMNAQLSSWCPRPQGFLMGQEGVGGVGGYRWVIQNKTSEINAQ